MDFDCAIRTDSPETGTTLKYDIFVEGFRLATLRFELQISRIEARSETARATVKPATTGFVSYSSKDKSRVLDRVSAVRIGASLDVEPDVTLLRTNEDWKRQLYDEFLSRADTRLLGSHRTIKVQGRI